MNARALFVYAIFNFIKPSPVRICPHYQVDILVPRIHTVVDVHSHGHERDPGVKLHGESKCTLARASPTAAVWSWD